MMRIRATHFEVTHESKGVGFGGGNVLTAAGQLKEEFTLENGMMHGLYEFFKLDERYDKSKFIDTLSIANKIKSHSCWTHASAAPLPVGTYFIAASSSRIVANIVSGTAPPLAGNAPSAFA